MLGAIIGDMVGSLFEFHPIKSKEFDLFNRRCCMSDDSLLTLDVAKVLLEHYPIDYSEKGLEIIKKELIQRFVQTVNSHRGAGWGAMFFEWAKGETDYKPYNSYGNGSAMRISPVCWAANSEEEVKKLSKAVTEITHNHPEGLKGAESVAMAIYLARIGKSKEDIKKYISKNYYPEILALNFDDLIEHYEFSEICQKSCPQAIYCFLISTGLEDAIRNCVAIGGDCDTTSAMAGAIAEAYYQKDRLSDFEDKFLYWMIDPGVEETIKRFHTVIGSKKFTTKVK